MFRKPKTEFQEIAKRWDNRIGMQISPDAQKRAEALKTLFELVSSSAAAINHRKASRLSEKGVNYFSDMLRGAFLIGYDYGKNYSTDIDALVKLDDFPVDVDVPIKEITQPLVDVAIQLVELAHSPGRVTLLAENKESVKKDMVGSIFTVAADYFFDGVRYAIKN